MQDLAVVDVREREDEPGFLLGGFHLIYHYKETIFQNPTGFSFKLPL